MGLVVFFAIITILKPGERTGTAVVAGAPGCSAPQPPSHPAMSVTMSAVLVLVCMVASRELRFSLL
jgi:hypothetical protein